MKTALETIESNMQECDSFFVDKNGDGYVDASLYSVLQAMKEYGYNCAQQALKDAAENATHSCEIDYVNDYDYSAGHNGMKGDIDKESILETEIKTP